MSASNTRPKVKPSLIEAVHKKYPETNDLTATATVSWALNKILTSKLLPEESAPQ